MSKCLTRRVEVVMCVRGHEVGFYVLKTRYYVGDGQHVEIGANHFHFWKGRFRISNLRFANHGPR